jgi:hypothetical protein
VWPGATASTDNAVIVAAMAAQSRTLIGYVQLHLASCIDLSEKRTSKEENKILAYEDVRLGLA